MHVCSNSQYRANVVNDPLDFQDHLFKSFKCELMGSPKGRCATVNYLQNSDVKELEGSAAGP